MASDNCDQSKAEVNQPRPGINPITTQGLRLSNTRVLWECVRKRTQSDPIGKNPIITGVTFRSLHLQRHRAGTPKSLPPSGTGLASRDHCFLRGVLDVSDELEANLYQISGDMPGVPHQGAPHSQPGWQPEITAVLRGDHS